MSIPISLAALAPVMKRIMVDTVQIFRPGPQVLNEDTGVYEPGPDVILWEGLGAVFTAGGPGMVLSLAGQAYQDDTRDRYRLLTPLEAPLASRDDCVRVTHATADQGLLGRVWRVLDISDANTLAVVRTTWMDATTQQAPQQAPS
ncbi:DUF6093 family protein [Streptomyces canus]|uniref:DUF6093 family protein n=1 Tax=Streptomyces canus TaxID=58343 RepID=UPI00225591CA|nr:DUF6093 family protein [Streptomyces canus]MCX4858333.1 DUF6093 family protein [Streptomyces canus]